MTIGHGTGRGRDLSSRNDDLALWSGWRAGKLNLTLTQRYTYKNKKPSELLPRAFLLILIGAWLPMFVVLQMLMEQEEGVRLLRLILGVEVLFLLGLDLEPQKGRS